LSAQQQVPYQVPPTTHLNNIKKVQESGAVVLRNHFTHLTYIRPVNQTRTFREHDKATYMLTSALGQYLNLGDGALFIKVRMEDNHDAITQWAAHGMRKRIRSSAVVFIENMEIYCGDKLLTSIQDYNVYGEIISEYSAEAQLHCSETFFGSRLEDDEYKNGLHQQEGSTGESIYVWLKVPLTTIFDDAGNIPIYQLAAPLRLEIKWASNASVFGVSGYPGTGSGWEEHMSSGHAVLTAGPSYTISDSYILGHVMQVLAGGELDDAPYTFWTNNVSRVTYPTLGTEEEVIPLTIKKSSLTKLVVAFLDPTFKTSGTNINCGIDILQRAGRLGGISHKLVAGGTAPIDQSYNPSIIHYQINVGDNIMPTAQGSGSQSAQDVITNEHIMWHDLQRYLYRNDVNGTLFNAYISPHDEKTSRMVEDIPTDHSSAAQTATSWLTNNTLLSDFGWQGYSYSTYGGPGSRIRLSGAVATYDTDKLPLLTTEKGNYPASTRTWAYAIEEYSRLPGGKFIIGTTFEPIDKAPDLVQGINSINVPIALNIRRQHAIDTTKFRMWPVIAEKETTAPSQAVAETFTHFVYDAPPRCYAFFTYKTLITIHDGVIDISE